MVQLAGQEKAINFFEYLRSLNMLTGKIKRDYREHDAVWFMDDIMAGFDCRVLDGVSEKGAVLEIRRPRISAEERMAPAAPRILDGWLGTGRLGCHHSRSRWNKRSKKTMKESAGPIRLSRMPTG